MGAEMYSSRAGKKCALYLRVSLERQTEGYSLDGQRRYLEDWAIHEGMTVVETCLGVEQAYQKIKRVIVVRYHSV